MADDLDHPDWKAEYAEYEAQNQKAFEWAVDKKYMEYGEFFKTRLEVTKAYSEGAKTFVQLSSAALALPLVFTQTILGKEVAEKGLHGLDRFDFWSLLVAWFSFLLTILSGVLYQWLAARRAWDDLHTKNQDHKMRYEHLFENYPKSRVYDRLERSYLYFAMIVCFCVGAGSFVFYAAHTMGLSLQDGARISGTSFLLD
jgi:hypothetical protein